MEGIKLLNHFNRLKHLGNGLSHISGQCCESCMAAMDIFLMNFLLIRVALSRLRILGNAWCK